MMKQYNNGQRKGMMYGGMSKRKPMMYGGTAKKSPRKKMQMGGNTMTNAVMSTNQTQQQMQQRDQQRMGVMRNPTPTQQRMGMSEGGKTKFGMLSVKAGVDNNPNPTQADRIVGAKKNKR